MSITNKLAFMRMYENQQRAVVVVVGFIVDSRSLSTFERRQLKFTAHKKHVIILY